MSSAAMSAAGTPSGEPVEPVRGRPLGEGGRFRCACCAPREWHFDAGRIASVVPLAPAAAGAEAGHDDDRIVMPPFANAHDHVRGVSPTALAAFDLPLELWLANMAAPPAVDPFLVAAAALGRQALGGCASIMIHYTRPQHADALPAELRVVAEAAKRIGIRVAIAPSLRDMNALGYGIDDAVLAALPGSCRESIRNRLLLMPPASAREQIRLVEDTAAELQGPHVDVQYGPYGMEWCSDGLLAAVSEASALRGRRVHMHMMESPVQREYLDARYPQGPLRFLDAIGLLTPRLSLGHAVWLRLDEMELLAERGVAVSINTGSNLWLHNGVAPVQEMHARGLRFAQGLDGFSLDDDEDAFRELRLNYLLSHGTGLEPGVGMEDWFRAACLNGRAIVTGDDPRESTLLTGGAADLLVIDRRRLSRHVLLEPDDASLVMRRGSRQAIETMIVAGRAVVRDGRLTGIDLDAVEDELSARLRAARPQFTGWREATTAWAAALHDAYLKGLHRRP